MWSVCLYLHVHECISSMWKAHRHTVGHAIGTVASVRSEHALMLKEFSVHLRFTKSLNGKNAAGSYLCIKPT